MATITDLRFSEYSFHFPLSKTEISTLNTISQNKNIIRLTPGV